MPVNALDLVGKEIITSDGRNLGSVSDIAFDVTTWRVRDLRAAIDKRVAEELGLPKRMGGGQFLIKTEHVKGVGDHILLATTMKGLAEMAASAQKTGDQEPFD